MDDGLPDGAAPGAHYEGWTWNASSGRASGSHTHESSTYASWHQHYFFNATQQLPVGTGDVLYAYVYLDPASPPQEVMLQWHAYGSWEQRAYWGANLIGWGVDGTASRRYMGPLPAAGGWVRLEVPAAQVGLEGKVLNGMAFTLYGGHAWWDRAGVKKASFVGTSYYSFNGQRVAMRDVNGVKWLHGDHLGSASLVTNGSGSKISEMRYTPWGEPRLQTTELQTDKRFTGQAYQAVLGSVYDYGARMYAPLLGRFISADTLVPGIENPQAWNRYSYVYNRPLNLTDSSGHCPICPTIVIGAVLGGVVMGGTYAAVSLANGNFDAGQLAMTAGAGAVAGGLIGSGIGIAAGMTAMSAAAATAVSGAAIGTGVGALSAGEGYLLSLPVSGGIDPSRGKFDAAEFASNYAAGGLSGLVKGVTRAGPVASTVVDTGAGALQSALSDKLHNPNQPIDPIKAGGAALLWGATSAVSGVAGRVSPIKTRSNPFASQTGIGEPAPTRAVRQAAALYARDQFISQSSQAIARNTLFAGASSVYDSYQSCRAGGRC